MFMSLQLYHFLCQHIVGTEEAVRTKRLMITLSDSLSFNDGMARIISGSFGEGLEMKGSDYDEMCVLKRFIVHEDTENVKLDPEKLNLIMEMNDTKPGYTKLRSVNLNFSYLEMFVQIGYSWYLSSNLFKLCCQKKICIKEPSIIHGPCLSDKDEHIDLAFCLHNPHWIQPAKNWISRGHTSWPSSDVKSEIIDHGILLVPIGCKGSDYEELEWRISFSVAEKLLIYSFSHTQLLCYALMKILLKDVINSNINCKNLLCSYFIKTIIFWVSEETPVTEWKPENLIPCFMKCTRRLVYCVEYLMCPHYFIPVINMFENKIDEQARKLLIGHLNTLVSFGWRSVLFSKQFQNFSIHTYALPSISEIKSAHYQFILTSIATQDPRLYKTYVMWTYRRCVRILNSINSSVIKLVHLRYLSIMCARIGQNIVTRSDFNKTIYSQHRKQLAYILHNIYHDALSGWLMLAAFFYRTKQYRNALHILSHALMKCTPEKVYYEQSLSKLTQDLTASTTLQRLGIMRVVKLLKVNTVKFIQGSTLVPEVLSLECLEQCQLPPVAFAHFLYFLCHYRLNDMPQCYKSIRDLQLTIDEQYFIADSYDEVQANILLGVAFQLVGKKSLAIRAFSNATQYETGFRTTAAERLSIMNMHSEEDE